MPKGAILNSGPVTLGTACIAERLGLTREDVLLATTPTSSSFQLVAALMPAIHVGAGLALVAGIRGRAVRVRRGTARGQRARCLPAHPLRRCQPRGPQGMRFRLALSGGSPLAPRSSATTAVASTSRSWRATAKVSSAASWRSDSLAMDERSLSGFVGRSLPDRPAIICDRNGEEVPAGQWGEVIVPTGYFAGYKNKAEATAETLKGGVLHTGDLGIADGDGYLKVLGRTHEQADAERRTGFLRDAEDAYYEHLDVKHATVVSGPQGQIEAFVELLPGRNTSGDQIAEFAAPKIPIGLRPVRTTVLEDDATLVQRQGGPPPPRATGCVMKVGLALYCDRPSRDLGDMAAAAEQAGFAEMWWADHYNAHELATVLTMSVVKTSTIKVGTGVTSVLLRHPSVLRVPLRLARRALRGPCHRRARTGRLGGAPRS